MEEYSQKTNFNSSPSEQNPNPPTSNHPPSQPSYFNYFHPLNSPKTSLMNSLKDKLLPRETIKFLSYNISLYSPISSISHPLYEEPRLDHFYKDLPKYDIICLQSISSTFSEHKINLIQEAQKKGFYFYSTSNTSTNTFSSYSMESGLLILSRFPIEKQCYIPYECCGSYIDTLREKGFLYSKIKIKDYAIHIITTALQSNEYSPSSKVLLNDLLRECSDIRKEQIKEMFTFIKEGIIDNKEIYNKSDLIILCGNFNIEQNGYKYLSANTLGIHNELTNEYNVLLMNNKEELKLENIFDKEMHIDKTTYGDYNDDSQRFECYLTQPQYQKSKMILDYIFTVSPSINTQSLLTQKAFSIQNDSLFIEKFLINYSPLIQISDHYGLSCEIEYTGDTIQQMVLSENDNDNDIHNENEIENVPSELKKLLIE